MRVNKLMIDAFNLIKMDPRFKVNGFFDFGEVKYFEAVTQQPMKDDPDDLHYGEIGEIEVGQEADNTMYICYGNNGYSEELTSLDTVKAWLKGSW